MLISILLSILFSPIPGHATSTPNYYKCNHSVGGEWNYGRAPKACDANSFGADSVVYNEYAPVIFGDSASRSSERTRYMEELDIVIRQAAAYYLRQRNPSVSQEELDWWTLGIQATASNESYWSHYRVASDGRLKMMRGDVGHGHGLMQIDDRAHFDAISKGIAWNLMDNLTYAMDIFYQQWMRAPSQRCVNGSKNWIPRIRSAWAAYNGGPSQICRWTNSKSSWARNDKNFYAALSGKTWERYIASPKSSTTINVRCLMENSENCPLNGGAQDPEAPLSSGVLYGLSDGSSCILSGGKLHCVSDYRDAICLRAIAGYDSSDPLAVADAQAAKYQKVSEDRHALCASYDDTLIAVGAVIEAQMNINVRATPGGGRLGTVPKGQLVPVTDFEIRNEPTNDRYYKIKYQNIEGYIYAGTTKTQDDWVRVSKSALPASVVQVSGTVRVVNSVGINMRATPGGAYLVRIPVNARLVVDDVVVQGSNNFIYYKVSYAGKTGYIYTGELLPTETVASWTIPVR